MVEWHNSCQMHINRTKLGHQLSPIFAPQTARRERDGHSWRERDKNNERLQLNPGKICAFIIKIYETSPKRKLGKSRVQRAWLQENNKRERERERGRERVRERERGRQTDRSCCKLLRKNINFIAIIKFNKYNLYATNRIKPNAGNNQQKEKADGQKKETACCIQWVNNNYPSEPKHLCECVLYLHFSS